MEIFTRVEFYVIAVMVAAAIVAFFARPHSAGPVKQFLLPTSLSLEGEGEGSNPGGAGESTPAAAPVQAIHLHANADGSVTLRRTGIPSLTTDGALSLAIEVKGFDIQIKERITRSLIDIGERVDTATVNLPFLAPEHYHLRYVNPDTELTASLTFHNRPGLTYSKALI